MQKYVIYKSFDIKIMKLLKSFVLLFQAEFKGKEKNIPSIYYSNKSAYLKKNEFE